MYGKALTWLTPATKVIKSLAPQDHIAFCRMVGSGGGGGGGGGGVGGGGGGGGEGGGGVGVDCGCPHETQNDIHNTDICCVIECYIICYVW